MDSQADAKREFGLAEICRIFAEASPHPMAAVEGPNHLISYLNPAFCALTGKPECELIGAEFCSAAGAEDECRALLESVYQSGQPGVHIERESPSASTTLCSSYSMWPVRAPDGHPLGILIQVTESASFGRRAAAMNQELLLASLHQHELAEAVNIQLRRANEDLKQFAFAAAHDLKEPLRMIAIYTELLVKKYRGQADSESSQYANFVIQGTERISNLLRDLLSYMGLSERETEPAETVDLNMTLETVKLNLKASIEESGAVVAVDPLPTVTGHPARLVQLFQNLIENAIKYRGESTLRIHVSAMGIDGEWRFAVEDNGIGIDPKYGEQIFGVFKRLHGKDIPGTGIGLAICQRVLERSGGRIWVESYPGQGATFYFTLSKS